MQTALLFTGAQINLIIAVAILFAALFVANTVLLLLFYYKRKKSKLCTEELQQRREQLLEELAQLRDFNPREDVEEAAEEISEDDGLDDIAEAADEDGEEDADEEETTVTDSGKFPLQVLAVRDMSPLMRSRLGLEGKEFDGKSYYVRYSSGFEAKLRSSSEEVKQRYIQFAEETGRYKKLSIARGFRQQRLYCGRKTVGLILFKGKTLCVAFALNPKKYEATKYRGIDVGEVNRFKKTPMLVKITSARKLVYAKYLLNRLAEDNMIALRAEPLKADYSAQELTRDEYFAQGMLKITLNGEVADGVNEE